MIISILYKFHIILLKYARVTRVVSLVSLTFCIYPLFAGYAETYKMAKLELRI